MKRQKRAKPWQCPCTMPMSVRAAVITATMSAIPNIGWSAESVLPITPPGSTDTDQALIPPVSGLYGGLFLIPYSADRHTYDSSGNRAPAAYSVHDRSTIFGPAFLYVYPFHLFGGTLGSSFVQPFERQSASFGYSKTVTNFGTADAYSDILQWSKGVGLLGATQGNLPMPYGLTLSAAFSLIIPDGQYDHNHIFKLGSHAWVPDPNVSLTYNTGPKLSLGSNTQISARAFYAIPTRDTTTDYTTGNILDIDFSITEQFNNWRIGTAGYYQSQITADHPSNGASQPNGNRFSEVAIGPIVQYFIPHTGAFIKLKYANTVYHRSFVDQDFLILSTGFKF